MKTYFLPKRTLLLWRIRAFLIAAALIFVCYYLPLPLDLTLILITAILFLFCAAVFWYLPKFIKGCRINIVNNAVIIKRGVVIENTHILPFTRLIHTLTVQTPLAKLLKLNMVLLKAARFKIFVPELHQKDADDLLTRTGHLTEEGYETEESYEKDL